MQNVDKKPKTQTQTVKQKHKAQNIETKHKTKSQKNKALTVTDSNRTESQNIKRYFSKAHSIEPSTWLP